MTGTRQVWGWSCWLGCQVDVPTVHTAVIAKEHHARVRMPFRLRSSLVVLRQKVLRMSWTRVGALTRYRAPPTGKPWLSESVFSGCLFTAMLGHGPTYTNAGWSKFTKVEVHVRPNCRFAGCLLHLSLAQLGSGREAPYLHMWDWALTEEKYLLSRWLFMWIYYNIKGARGKC